ncbi:hypothetical protein I315_00360 [Cryptococcus gattii Ru294]|uniref:Uncharacterized protein n=2 Tax=Cryptococcus gattii TaxID=37769 RepID=E6R470_CRYGW|nr:Hypothetical Protein CGB_D5550W [Cryptococcus gattii WM276]KIR57197.1 hypothetical protein I315_00360 [Cryptococcus gattii Ru294]KIR80793.1 hypothetical protein I306_02250 [Cryptococcus gattii EJB2]KIY35651.1 hypothetical protein I305_01902 [Cryptococcus gattii E566]KJE03320.1 hypothetical protein I311_02882 [Cryptococcus gattii NT-10]ADV21861.1 Hypothetical Protein CGB_D5550W [Cryptococcus gattii WM276]
MEPEGTTQPNMHSTTKKKEKKLREKGQQEASIVYHYLATVPDSSQLTTNIRYSLVEVNKQ